MKSLPNIRFSLKNLPTDSEGHTTATLLKFTLAQPPAQGFDFVTMRARNKIADACDKTPPDTATLELEDADFAIARKCVEDYRWGASHPDLLRFAELFGL